MLVCQFDGLLAWQCCFLPVSRLGHRCPDQFINPSCTLEPDCFVRSFLHPAYSLQSHSSLRDWERQNFAVFLQLFFADVVNAREASHFVFVNRVGEFCSAVQWQHSQEVRRFRCGAVVQQHVGRLSRRLSHLCSRSQLFHWFQRRRYLVFHSFCEVFQELVFSHWKHRSHAFKACFQAFLHNAVRSSSYDEAVVSFCLFPPVLH